MSKSTLFDNLLELDEKFSSFFRHKKKVKALENYSTVKTFDHRNFLSLLKRCLKNAFLDSKEADFLDHLLLKYELNYLDWFHKTPWLKRHMQKIVHKRGAAPQIMFDFAKVGKVPAMPVQLLGQKLKQIQNRA